MIHHFLVNPAAGKGNLTDSLMRKLHRTCGNRGVDYRIHLTTRPGDATEYVRAAAAVNDTPQRFYACGGDGTLCEVINGAPRAENVEFAVIPIGTGNDFERNFSSPDNFFDIDRQLDGTLCRLDLMRYNDRFSLNALNIGFDCNVVKKTGEIKRSPLIPTGLAYPAGVAITLCKPFGTKMRVELPDGTVLSDSFLLALAANGAYYGGGFKPAPRASLTDGLLDLCVIKKMSRFRFLKLVGKYKAGTHLDDPSCAPLIRYLQLPSVRFFFEHPIDICVDGELEMTDYVEVEVVPQALSFSIPAGSTLLVPEREESPAAADGPEGQDEGEKSAEALPV